MAGQTTGAPSYNPLWNQGVRRRGRTARANLAIAASILVHAGLFYYVYETKFAPRYTVYGPDDAVQVDLKRLVKPPPPPPPEEIKPPPVDTPPPPPMDAPILRTPITVAGDYVGPVLTLPEPEPPAPPPPPVVQAPPAPPPPRVIANPTWSSRPSGEDMARYYPEKAQREERGGKVLLECQVTAKGTVTGCVVAAENPAEYKFGEAAVNLSRMFKMRPKLEDGQAVEGAMVRIPITFRLE